MFDAGALIALEKRQGPMLAIMDQLLRNAEAITIPSTVLAQVWRNDPRQHRLATVTRWADIADLDVASAREVGTLLAESGTRDVVDAHVIVTARTAHADRIITSDPEDLTALDSTIRLWTI
ncbi:hypothetical protein ACFXNW_05895 [Nocardia sp. NPDC059180]|uniref:hypothetical protein n=1 Tax=Nocardia sp. NPDC059180 TaxID=3346761 RepID=UPI00369AE809